MSEISFKPELEARRRAEVTLTVPLDEKEKIEMLREAGRLSQENSLIEAEKSRKLAEWRKQTKENKARIDECMTAYNEGEEERTVSVTVAYDWEAGVKFYRDDRGKTYGPFSLTDEDRQLDIFPGNEDEGEEDEEAEPESSEEDEGSEREVDEEAEVGSGEDASGEEERSPTEDEGAGSRDSGEESDHEGEEGSGEEGGGEEAAPEGEENIREFSPHARLNGKTPPPQKGNEPLGTCVTCKLPARTKYMNNGVCFYCQSDDTKE